MKKLLLTISSFTLITSFSFNAISCSNEKDWFEIIYDHPKTMEELKSQAEYYLEKELDYREEFKKDAIKDGMENGSSYDYVYNNDNWQKRTIFTFTRAWCYGYEMYKLDNNLQYLTLESKKYNEAYSIRTVDEESFKGYYESYQKENEFPYPNKKYFNYLEMAYNWSIEK
ncbi:hypothetical protein [Spiroplasma turonicum]|uniref:Lipoprotein n=1 Tax=Spiroplasma turonicum TaxID=216946 RepID=A0A0K1P785_9MOLU|nr:hypothetical protein [Spiroplasma turonicum]AKU80150.1 hypothetical protein STURON_00904 [Spiroplasma turonicum]ALX71150.1 hypothetical protein STURO_v1c08990 [Spiroplasma turonicum]